MQSQGDGGAIVITNSQGINVLDPAQAYRATAQISGTTFINNTAQNGGGISVTNAGLIVSNSLFEYNFATQAGAGRGGAVVGEYPEHRVQVCHQKAWLRVSSSRKANLTCRGSYIWHTVLMFEWDKATASTMSGHEGSTARYIECPYSAQSTYCISWERLAWILAAVWVNCRCNDGFSSRAATFAGILFTDVVIQNCYAVFSGGGLHTEAAITLGACTGMLEVIQSLICIELLTDFSRQHPYVHSLCCQDIVHTRTQAWTMMKRSFTKLFGRSTSYRAFCRTACILALPVLI